jgi:hypothetical protein
MHQPEEKWSLSRLSSGNAHLRAWTVAALSPFFRSPGNGALFLYVCIAVAVSCLPFIAWHEHYIATMLHDCVFIADLGYRMVNGQMPHADFVSPIGIAFVALIAAGTYLGSTMIESLRVASCLAAILVLPVVLYVAKTRLSSGCALLLVGICLLALIVPVNIGDPPTAITYASFYNRLSYVLILLVMLLTIGEPDGSRRHRILDGALVSSIVVVLVYTKVNYGILALGFLAFWGAYKGSWKPLAGSLLSVAGAAAALEVFVRSGIIGSYLHDLQLAVSSSGPLRPWAIRHAILTTRTEFLLSVIAIPFLSHSLGMLERREMWGILCVYIIGVLLIAQTGQAEGLFVVMAPSLVLASRLRGQGMPDRKLSLVRGHSARVLLLVGGVAVAASSYIIRPALAAIGQVAAVQPSAVSTVRVSDIPALRDLVLHADGNVTLLKEALSGTKDAFQVFTALRFSRRPAQYLGQDEYLESVRDGVKLLDNCPRSKGVMTLDFANPFPLLRATPPAGGMSWFHYQRTFTERHHPGATRLFAGVDCLMVPKLPVSQGETAWLLMIYGPYLNDNFKGRFESPFWSLLTR